MNKIQEVTFKNHLLRLRAGASQATALTEVSKWISRNTTINGRNFSYKNHEYQPRILDSTARECVIRKCSQVGISELSIRKALALCGMIKEFTVVYTLPTATLASVLVRTRVNPVIEESAYLKGMLTGTDSVEVKQFGAGSFLYMKGAASSNAPISIPTDFLVHDELDFSDPLVISQYQSRLTHSLYKMRLKLSTPTIPGKGIDSAFMQSKRHFNFARCNHCNHYFIPDYYDHVKIPGYSGDLRDITKTRIHTINHTEAYVECPKCGKKPNLAPKYREWVCENKDENHVADGFQVSPFDCPNLITPSYLIEASTSYTNIGEFINFNLGLPHFSRESVLSPDEVQGVIVNSYHEGSAFTVMGVDLGKTCHITIARCSFDGAMQVVHIEEVPLAQLKIRYRELRTQYRVRAAVIDSLPYTDMVMALQAEDMNLWACVYTESSGVHLYTVHKADQAPESGTQEMRQLNVSKDRTFDALMDFIRSGDFSKVSCQLDSVFVSHCTDMRRVKDWSTKQQAMKFKWVKSEQGEDHFWYSTSYAYLAKFMIGTVSGAGGGTLPMIYSFKVKQVAEAN
jgi:hypothetical protein